MLNSTFTPYVQLSFETYSELVKGKAITKNRVIEESGDLFDAPADQSFAHCVSQDLQINNGTALLFRRKFGNVAMLKSQHPRIHEVIYMRQGERYILHMITKNKYWQKTSLEDMFLTIQNLRAICIELNIEKLAISRIGTENDQLDMSVVRTMIRFVFKESNIKVHIYP